MAAAKPKPGTTLTSDHDSGVALVIERGDSLVDALLDLVVEEYGGPKFTPDNPAIVAAMSDVKIETWRSCSKQWREDNGADEWEAYWSTEGDGRRLIEVLWYPDDVYELGLAAEAAEARKGWLAKDDLDLTLQDITAIAEAGTPVQVVT